MQESSLPENHLRIARFAQLILDSQSQLSGSTHPPTIPQITGVLLGVKPAVYMPNPQDTDAILGQIRPEFGEFEFIDSFLVNVSALKSRLHRDRSYLERLGLGEIDHKAFIAHANPEGGTLQENLVAGFVLGYPLSALQSFEQRDELQKRRVFDLDFLGFVCSDETLMDQFGLAALGQDKEQILAFGRACEENRRTHGFVPPAFFGPYKTLLTRILKNHFHASDTDIEFLFNQQYVDIEGVLGFGTAYPNAPDVKALRQEVEAALG